MPTIKQLSAWQSETLKLLACDWQFQTKCPISLKIGTTLSVKIVDTFLANTQPRM